MGSCTSRTRLEKGSVESICVLEASSSVRVVRTEVGDPEVKWIMGEHELNCGHDMNRDSSYSKCFINMKSLHPHNSLKEVLLPHFIDVHIEAKFSPLASSDAGLQAHSLPHNTLLLWLRMMRVTPQRPQRVCTLCLLLMKP